uniref:Merozoite surface antigen-2b n=1 Tax=Babesia bovis TaxID=5865 RepID=M1VBM6_BABBO|nr:merozoite surface antigen-2b [Babesia bovis]
MIGKIFLLTACCCASLLSVSASEESQETSSTTLHDEMKEVANLIALLTKDENRGYLEEKFKEANMPSDSSRDALNAFVEILDNLGEEVPFETTLFDDYVLGNLKHQDPDDIFNSLLVRVPLIKTMLSKFNAFLNDNPQRMLGSGKDKITEYYKEHISTKDAKVKDYTFLVKFCNDFLDSESPFMRIYRGLNKYEELVKKTPGKPSTPTHSSSQTNTTSGPSQDSVAPSKPAETPKPAGSSFTFGGLTVATLCYFVLSAF